MPFSLFRNHIFSLLSKNVKSDYKNSIFSLFYSNLLKILTCLVNSANSIVFSTENSSGNVALQTEKNVIFLSHCEINIIQ